MDIHKLEPGVITKIKSSSTISSITHCITELVLNSLDAKSSAIAIRINFITFRIQVVDNGDGITKNNLILLGQRYMTNKCSSLCQTKVHASYYGFRGEALANIINISQNVEISSKPKNSKETWSQTFIKGTVNEVFIVKDRPSSGTTVTIEDFLYNLPLRKKCTVPEVELFQVKRNIECLIIMHPHVSFSLRNDVTGDLILNSQKCKTIISSFLALHPDVNDDYSLIKVSKSRVTVKGLLFKQMFQNNSMQYMYVNKRPIKCSKLQIFISQLFQKNMKYSKETLRDSIVLDKKHKHPAYVINITCPCSFVDILPSPNNSVVEFKNWDIVYRCIEKIMLSFFGNDKCLKRKSLINPKLRNSNCGVSKIYGAVRSYGFKRKNNSSDRRTSTPAKIKKLTQVTDIKTVGITDIPDIKTRGKFSTDKVGEDLIESKNFSIQNSPNHLGLQNEIQNQNTNNISDFSYKNDHWGKDGSDIIGNNSVAQKPKYLTKKHLHPLPVTVFTKYYIPPILNTEKYKDSLILSKQINEEVNHVTNVDLCTKFNTCKLLQEKSFLSKQTYDEKKGKNIIMDMFLKSTQVYNSEDDSDDRSQNTVMEMESNYFLENNITTNVNGKCKTMSLSVNITKRIKQKCKKNKQLRMTSKSVQTSQQQNKKMRTKYVQTSNTYPVYDIIDRNNCSNKTRLENCTVILTNEVPYFKFINNDRQQLFKPETFVEDINCNCKCHNHFLKSFNTNYLKNNINKKYTELLEENNFNTKLIEKNPTHQNQSDNICHQSINSDLFCKDSASYYYNRTDRKNIQEGIYYGTNQDCSNNESHMKQQYTFFNPPYKSTAQSLSFDEECSGKKIKNKEPKINEDVTMFHFSISKVNTPYDVSKTLNSVVPNEKINCSRRNVILCPKEVDSTVLYTELHKMSHFKLGKHFTDHEENLFITLSNEQKQEILKRELSIEQKINNLNLEWESQIAVSKEKEDINKPNEFGYDWIQKQNNFGNHFYVNRRTGFSTFYTPKTSNRFKLSERIDFVPKGLSPIMKEIKKVDKSLSQNKKDKLELYILESHQNELLKIKWQNYIKDNDPKTFFDEVYKEKLNSFENCIPRLCNNKKISELNPFFFSKTLFSNITVIGPVDKKFIVALEETNNLLILFDQHAVHERIRLEQLLERYSNATVPLHGEKLMIFLSCNDKAMLQKHEQYLNYLGLHVTFFQNGITVAELPLCIYNKFSGKVASTLLPRIIQILIKEIINLIKETGGVRFKSLPRIIHDIINLEACRGAIKFGDIITKNDCEQLLKKLSNCDLPFQCAHGRPTLTPLLPLNLTTQINSQKINFQNLFS